MAVTFQRLAYEALDVCNGVEMSTVLAAVERTELPVGAQAIDVGTGNAAVAIALADRFGLRVDAVEFDVNMADLARTRIVASSVADRVVLHEGSSHRVMPTLDRPDLITALGATNLTGEGRPTPQAGFAFLADRLKARGWLLWGDIVWRAEPSEPLRQVSEATNIYADDAGWRAAAHAAGFEVVWAEISPQTVFDAYADASVGAAAAWLASHPDDPAAQGVRFHADRMRTIFAFGRGVLGFGLYLLRRRD